ncbi:head-tail joining protein [Azospirillum palustre]
MIDFDRFAVAPAFLTFGEAATYTPPAGSPMPCRVIREGGGKPVKFGPVTVYLASLAFDVRASDVPDPTTGGVFTVGAMAYTVTGTPYHPEDDPHGLVWSCGVLWGAPILYRSSTGDGDTQNPPRGSEWELAAAAGAGSVSVAIAGMLAGGQLGPGDRVTIGTTVHTITTTTKAASGRFDNVGIAPALAAPAAAGLPVVLGFARDFPVLAGMAGYDDTFAGTIATGTRRIIVMQDRLTAAGCTDAPKLGDVVTFEGQTFAVGTATALYQGAAPFAWDLQCG